MEPIKLRQCLKNWTRDLDKACSPAETIACCHKRLASLDLDILSQTRRIDTGRLGIPVFLAVAGNDARQIMPTRKQMGKGSSPEQAEASALMELVERFSFFSFWQNPANVVCSTWSRAKRKFGDSLISTKEILASVQDSLDENIAEEILDTREWLFYPATRLSDEKIVWLPIDWFRMLGEFNGSSAGNTNEESLLQGISELIERHVSALVCSSALSLPTISQQSCSDHVLKELTGAFANNGVKLLLKDISLGYPLPTVAALAWDPATFPDASEIVFTAGTATSPAKAAIRAITEVAQLGGDFHTRSCYEASGLPKFASLEECQWLFQGREVSLSSLPDAENADICHELEYAVRGLYPLQTYAIQTTHSRLGIPAHWLITPGLQFRERDRNQSLGLFVGRKLAEESAPEEARPGLEIIGRAYPDAHFLSFFNGLISLREGSPDKAATDFIASIDMQPDADSRALAAFYAGYSMGQNQQWNDAIPFLQHSLAQAPTMHETANLLGVAFFKTAHYDEGEKCFDMALKLDKGSAIDLANRGICRKFQGKFKSAKQDLEEALLLEPDLDFARQHLLEMTGAHDK